MALAALTLAIPSPLANPGGLELGDSGCLLELGDPPWRTRTADGVSSSMCGRTQSSHPLPTRDTKPMHVKGSSIAPISPRQPALLPPARLENRPPKTPINQQTPTTTKLAPASWNSLGIIPIPATSTKQVPSQASDVNTNAAPPTHRLISVRSSIGSSAEPLDEVRASDGASSRFFPGMGDGIEFTTNVWG